MTDREEWRPVVGFEGYYEVSNMGRVRSLDRYYTDSIGRDRVRYGKVLKGGTGAGVYRMHQFVRDDGVYHPRYVHDVVAAAFIGPKPPGMCTRHKDDDPSNNTPDNLAYGTQIDNMKDAIRNDLFTYGEDHHQAIYPNELIAELKSMRGKMNSVQASRIIGLNARYIRSVWAGEVRTRV